MSRHKLSLLTKNGCALNMNQSFKGVLLGQGMVDRVKEYEKVNAAFANTREEFAKHEDELKTLEAERKTAYEDLTLQRTVARKFKEEEQALDSKIQTVRAERMRIKALAVSTRPCIFTPQGQEGS
jgi:chromosome segregation ATPase